MSFKRSYADIVERHQPFWPEAIVARQAEHAPVGLVEDTFDAFCELFERPITTLDQLWDAIADSPFATQTNLLVKHLQYLSDVGGEMLNRINAYFDVLFPDGELTFAWNGLRQTYRFTALPLRGKWSGSRIGYSTGRTMKPRELDDLVRDLLVLLLFGGLGAADDPARSLAPYCAAGQYLGNPAGFARYQRSRYLAVSKLTSGSRAAVLGNLVQTDLVERLRAGLADLGVEVRRGKPPVEMAERLVAANLTEVDFDVIAVRDGKLAAFEVAFQETGNSVVERKAGQAQQRRTAFDAAGYKIGYVLDGAVVTDRRSVTERLCEHGDIVVTYNPDDIAILVAFCRDYFGVSPEPV